MDILFFGSIDWHGKRKLPSHHVVELLTRSHRVLYVDNFGGLRPLAISDIPRAVQKVRRMLDRGLSRDTQSGGERAGPNLVVAQPFVVPQARLGRIGEAANIALLRMWLRQQLKRHAIENPIVWTRVPSPTVWHAIEDLPRRALVYQSVDRYPDSPMIPQKLRPRLREYEARFCRTADAVFVSARGLFEEKCRINPRTHLFLNGVHTDMFRAPGAPIAHGLPGPVVGFAGALGPWIDYALLAAVASRTPAWSYVLLGAAGPGIDLTPLRRLPNVHLMGEVPHGELPAWFRSFDCGLIPYRIDRFTEFTFPSKLAEYLAAGLPVVSTRLPELAEYEDVVSVADSDGMVAAIEAALARRTSPAFREASLAVARSLSWEHVVEGMNEVLAHLVVRGRP